MQELPLELFRLTLEHLHPTTELPRLRQLSQSFNRTVLVLCHDITFAVPNLAPHDPAHIRHDQWARLGPAYIQALLLRLGGLDIITLRRLHPPRPWISHPTRPIVTIPWRSGPTSDTLDLCGCILAAWSLADSGGPFLRTWACRFDAGTEGHLALLFAAQVGGLSAVSVVRRYMADEATPASALNAALIGCVYADRREMTALLLTDPRVDPACEANAPLCVAAEYGRMEIVEMLLERREVDPAARNDEAMTAAAANGCDQVVKLLLRTGRAIRADNIRRLMQFARAQGHLVVYQLLKDWQEKAGLDVLAFGGMSNVLRVSA